MSNIFVKSDESKRVLFVIETPNTHYVFGVNGDGFLRHIHWGHKSPLCDYCVTDDRCTNSNHSALDMNKGEYTPHGGTMYHENSLMLTFSDSCSETVLTYVENNVVKKQNETTLCVKLRDNAYNIDVLLYYTVYDDSDVIKRNSVIVNKSEDDVIVNKAASGEFNLPLSCCYKSINTNGAWGGEYVLETEEVKNGSVVYESRKGTSSHNNSPYFILSGDANEDFGDVFFAGLGWSGNFKVEISRDYMNVTRAVIGINDFDFSYTLKPGDEFTTPFVYCGYTSGGLGAMSRMSNRFCVNHILPDEFAHKDLPVLYNSWEATEFDVNVKDQLELAKKAAQVGCELFVMDDGWFGKRNNDKAGLGDWFVNMDKFPNGLSELIDGVNKLGMDFGLWFEPEMVNPDSDLYRNHSDWTYHYDTRIPSLLRNQLVLNLTKKEVRDYLYERLNKMLTDNNIKYIKWDMNRPFSESGAENLTNRQELWYLHTVAVYNIIDELKAAHPDLQIESCSSGGGRSDFGALSHCDMVWPSDNTDPIDRLHIQRGYSMLYPNKCMRAWITDANKCSRPVPIGFRCSVSMQGALSLGCNLNDCTGDELAVFKRYVDIYKTIRHTIQFGDLYRLMNYNDDNVFATQYSDDNQSVVFVNGAPTSLFGQKFIVVRPKGLQADKLYSVKEMESGKTFTVSGGTLMNVGLSIELSRPLVSFIFEIKPKLS